MSVSIVQLIQSNSSSPVGKTALVTRFMYDSFNNQYNATVGIDLKSKTMYSDGRTLRLQVRNKVYVIKCYPLKLIR